MRHEALVNLATPSFSSKIRPGRGFHGARVNPKKLTLSHSASSKEEVA